MGGSRTTRAIKNSTARPRQIVRGQLKPSPEARTPAKRTPRTGRHVPRPETIRTNVRTRRVARARTPPGLRVARGEAGLARGKARAAVTGKAGAGRGIAAGGVEGDNVINSKAAAIVRTPTARMMAETSTCN